MENPSQTRNSLSKPGNTGNIALHPICRERHSSRSPSRSRYRNQPLPRTLPEHRPKSHQAHLEWPPSRLIARHTAQLIERILADKPHPRDGIPRMSGDPSSGEDLLARPHRSRQRVERWLRRQRATSIGSYSTCLFVTPNLSTTSVSRWANAESAADAHVPAKRSQKARHPTGVALPSG